MAVKPVPIRISENLLEIVDSHTKATRSDRSTVMRQWLWRSAEHELVNMVGAGQLTIGRAAELLELTHYDIYRMAAAHSIQLGASEDAHAIGRNLVGDSVQPRE